MKKWLVVAGGVAAIAILVALSLVRRDTEGTIKMQHEQELKAELLALNDFQTWYKAQQDAPDPTIARVFLSKGMIDSLLASFSGLEVPIPIRTG